MWRTLRLSLLVLTITTGASFAADDPSQWQTYRSPDYGFTIKYPAKMEFHPGHPNYAETRLSYIPVCEESTVACFEYTGKDYEGTNFEAAGLSVNILRDMRTEADCNKIDSGSYPVKLETIHGVQFHYGEAGSGGMSHFSVGPSYRTFHQEVCFDISLLVAGTAIGVYDPGTVKEFDSTALDTLLNRMVHTFRFKGAVTDGPAWKVYYDGGCGGDFEYPDTDTVVTSVYYSNVPLDSKDVNCSAFFTDHGMTYTVAAKANVKSGVEEWLRKSGYVVPNSSEPLGTSAYTTEYDAGPYHYVIANGTLYIISVSDAKHSVVVHRDKIFMHLLSSFKSS